VPRITCITRIWQAKACFFKHELSLINHELTINGWRGLLFLRVIALRIANPYSILRQIANLPQLESAATGICRN
jgi:hypothetical protein